MMKVCAAIDDPAEIPLTANADLVEIDVDLFERISEKIDKPLILKVTERRKILTWKDPIESGYIDIGEHDPPYKTDLTTISSVHNTERSLTSDDIVELLNSFKGDIVSGTFKIIRPADLLSLYDASKSIKRPHILLGRGEMGLITRVRPQVLNNEFIYAHTGPKSSPEQLTTEELKSAGENCMILGLLGHPLKHKWLKNMMTQAMKDIGIKGYYLNFDVPTIEYMGEVIRRYDIKGMNVTLPFKKEISAYTDSLDDSAKSTGMVNLINNTGSKIIGSNTDVYGIDFALKRSELAVEDGMKVLVMGNGGVAKASVFYMMDKGAEVTAAGINENLTESITKQFKCSKLTDNDPSKFDMIVNCIPSVQSPTQYPIDISEIISEQTIFDISLDNDTPLRSIGRARHCREIPGVDVFIGQGMKSFEIWTGKLPDYESLKKSLYYE